MGKLERVCISIPSDLLAEFDDAIMKMGYPNRSKAVQDAMRSFLSEFKELKALSGEASGAIIMLYVHRKPGLVQELLEIQHEHDELIVATMHVHLTEEECLEVITVRGDVARIRSLANALRTRKGVRALKAVIV